VHAYQLVQAAVSEHAVPVLVDIHAVRGAGSLAFEEHAEGNRRSRSGRQHQMRVAGAEPVGDGSAGLVEHDTLTPDRPLAGEGPVVEVQVLGELVGAAFVEGGAVR
jgi:hypothetical protein